MYLNIHVLKQHLLQLYMSSIPIHVRESLVYQARPGTGQMVHVYLHIHAF